MKPEDLARQNIDKLLAASGWHICGVGDANIHAADVLRPVVVLAEFMAYMLQSPLGRSQIDDRKTQTAQANLFQEKIRQLIFALPPLAEPVRIVAEIDLHPPIIREVESEVDANLQRAQALRQATLSK